MAQNRDTTPTSTGDRGGGIFTVVSVTVLVGTEIIGAALAGGWAVAGALDLGSAIAYALMGIFGIGGLALLVMFVRSALRVEGAHHNV
jgi:hypothetical protein